MKGWIFGSAKQKQWTQRIFKFSTKFQNPLHQNYKHIKTLESSLSIPLESIYSIIVFVGNSRFKTAMPDNVMHARGLIKFIKSKQTDLLTKKQLHHIIKTIKAGQLQPSFKTSRDHVAHVKDIVSNKQSRKSRYKQ